MLMLLIIYEPEFSRRNNSGAKFLGITRHEVTIAPHVPLITTPTHEVTSTANRVSFKVGGAEGANALPDCGLSPLDMLRIVFYI